MASKTFTTYARIELQDALSGPMAAMLAKLAAHSKQASGDLARDHSQMANNVGKAHQTMALEIERAQKGAALSVEAAQAAMRASMGRTDRATAEMAAIQQRAARSVQASHRRMGDAAETQFGRMATAAKSAGGIMSLALAGMATAQIRAAASDAYQFDQAATRLKALAGDALSPEQNKALQRHALNSPFVGSPVEVEAAYTAAVQSGITKPDEIAAAVEAAKAFQIAAGHSTGQMPELAESVKLLLEHTQMLGDLRNERNERITPSQATPDQLRHGELSAAGRLETFAQAGGGDSNKAYEFFKFAAPSALAANIPVEQLLEMGAQLGRRGIQGSLAGVAMRSIDASLLAPTAKARTQFKELGVDYGKYVTVDTDAMNPANIAKAMELRAGPLNARTRAAIARDIAAFKQDHDLGRYQESAARDLQASGSRNMRNPVSAQTLARDTSAGFITKLDVEGLLAALRAANASIGAYNAIFGSRQGGNASIIDPASMGAEGGVRGFITRRAPEDMGRDMIEDQRRSYSGSIDAAEHARQSARIALADPFKPAVIATNERLIEAAERVTNASDPQRAGIAGAVGGVAIGGAVMAGRQLLGLPTPAERAAAGQAAAVRPASVAGSEAAARGVGIRAAAVNAERASAGELIRLNAEREWRAITLPKWSDAPAGTRAAPAVEETGSLLGKMAGRVMGDELVARLAASGMGRAAVALGRAAGIANPFLDLGMAGYAGYEAGQDPEYLRHYNERDAERARQSARQFTPLEADPLGVEGTPPPALRSPAIVRLAAEANRAAATGNIVTDGEKDDTRAAVRLPAVEFMVPPASVATPTAAAPAKPVDVRVTGEATLDHRLVVEMTGSDVFADKIIRRVQSTVPVNLGQSLVGGQGLRPGGGGAAP